MPPTLSYLIDLARQAGDTLRAGYGSPHDITHKGVVDLVTEADHRSEDLLLGAIRKDFPSHRIITEESGQLDGDGDHCWYIDPLDGTANYAHHVPFFCVSIAYAHCGQAQHGVIYEPMRDECFSAEKGRGAWLNSSPIHVSCASELINSLLVTGFPYSLLNTPLNNFNLFQHFSHRSQGVRRLGSAALDLAYVAAGRLDGYWEVILKTWDIAAGSLLVQEAGGIATKMDGSDSLLTPPTSILAANPTIYKLLIENINLAQMM
jgi:myo-inositol-1(or 4)-monophosphatase